ncbi:T-cell surface glycoprotein CD1c-like isoform X2 [Trichosurus vulpecula]|uniref:T-cell surface glycoprotein CD1c-like isoform X2 n=1 Tax=Trichosurus vulpecula TaxID=9337 RepID=UPI00186B2ABE|nr:T-cell surface glycoprotein CD1c-like isoform X2 [Trichosurus vulpecula]
MLSPCLAFLLLLPGLSEGWQGETASQEPLTFQCHVISSFPNNSWVQNLGSGWLGDLETHRWNPQNSTILFLWPWARAHFNAERWDWLQTVIKVFLLSFTRDVQDFAKFFGEIYPFVIQMRVSCFQKSPVSFFQVAFQGKDFMSFQGDSWEPAPGAESISQNISSILNQDQGTRFMLQSLLNGTLPQFLDGLLDAGRRYIGRQGFYPKLVRVTWMKNGQEQPGTQTGDLLPNSDGTWYLQVILIVEAGETASLACRVEHSSLDGQDIIRYWAKSSTWPLALGISAVIVVVIALLLFGVIWWRNKRRSYEDIL